VRVIRVTGGVGLDGQSGQGFSGSLEEGSYERLVDLVKRREFVEVDLGGRSSRACQPHGKHRSKATTTKLTSLDP
jgi:hypothetical protein